MSQAGSGFVPPDAKALSWASASSSASRGGAGISFSDHSPSDGHQRSSSSSRPYSSDRREPPASRSAFSAQAWGPRSSITALLYRAWEGQEEAGRWLIGSGGLGGGVFDWAMG